MIRTRISNVTMTNSFRSGEKYIPTDYELTIIRSKITSITSVTNWGTSGGSAGKGHYLTEDSINDFCKGKSGFTINFCIVGKKYYIELDTLDSDMRDIKLEQILIFDEN